MASREDRVNEGRGNARSIRGTMGQEVRGARLAGGLSQLAAGAAAGMSHAQFGRIERGELRELTVDQLSRACAAVGLRLVIRAYPDGDPVRDAAQLALLERFRSCLPPGTRWRTEVPLPIAGDRRAWDGVVTLGNGSLGVEAETRLRDIQALERRLALKLRDGGLERMVLVVSDTRSNRRVVDIHRAALRPLLPLDARDILSALRSGRLPEASGIILL
jgi:transcriptional regulator with XRE-family HTH domain